MLLTTEKLAALIKAIESNAGKTVRGHEDDFNAYDYSGGNYDDAYYLGTSDGERMFADELKAIIDG